MTQLTIADFDLPKAWARVKADQSHRVFVRHPFEVQLVESSLAEWFEHLRVQMARSEYSPKVYPVCEVPKAKGAIRPGCYLSLEDAVIYTALVGDVYSAIHSDLTWSQGTVDFSYVLNSSPDATDWLMPSIVGWRQFREHSLRQIDDGCQYVVVADITAFYDSVDIGMLTSDLRRLGMSSNTQSILGRSLNKLAQINWVPGRGIPQGYSASDVLAKLYLNSIDVEMCQDGFKYCRYVDDIRVFCDSLVEAKTVLKRLSALLRRKGLCLQSAKSAILPVQEARTKISGIAPTILGINRLYIERAIQEFEQAAAAYGFDGDYISVYLAENLLLEDTQDMRQVPMRIVRETYREYFLTGNHDFEKTLFHFLLNKLGRAKDGYAIYHCLSLLRDHPEETDAILKYVRDTEQQQDATNLITEYLESEEAIYEYQKYRIIEWMATVGVQPTPRLLELIRGYLSDLNLPHYLRSVARNFIGIHGVPRDFDELERSYVNARESLEQCEIIISMRRMETGRRNSFMARVSNDGFLNSRAVSLVRSGEIEQVIIRPGQALA